MNTSNSNPGFCSWLPTTAAGTASPGASKQVRVRVRVRVWSTESAGLLLIRRMGWFAVSLWPSIQQIGLPAWLVPRTLPFVRVRSLPGVEHILNSGACRCCSRPSIPQLHHSSTGMAAPHATPQLIQASPSWQK